MTDETIENAAPEVTRADTDVLAEKIEKAIDVGIDRRAKAAAERWDKTMVEVAAEDHARYARGHDVLTLLKDEGFIPVDAMDLAIAAIALIEVLERNGEDPRSCGEFVRIRDAISEYGATTRAALDVEEARRG